MQIGTDAAAGSNNNQNRNQEMTNTDHRALELAFIDAGRRVHDLAAKGLSGEPAPHEQTSEAEEAFYKAREAMWDAKREGSSE